MFTGTIEPWTSSPQIQTDPIPKFLETPKLTGHGLPLNSRSILARISPQLLSGTCLRVCGRETFRYVAVSQYLQPVHGLHFAASGLAGVDVIAALHLGRRGLFARDTSLHFVC